MLDSSFPALLEGAHGAIYSKNPDRCRHFASSHRELCTLLLHALAPDGAVRKWTTDPNHFQNGNPTRKARLLYIARRAQNTPFKEFFTQNFLNQMQLLNADEHQKNQDYTEEQLILLHKNFISTLHFLKEFMKGNSDRVE